MVTLLFVHKLLSHISFFISSFGTEHDILWGSIGPNLFYPLFGLRLNVYDHLDKIVSKPMAFEGITQSSSEPLSSTKH